MYLVNSVLCNELPDLPELATQIIRAGARSNGALRFGAELYPLTAARYLRSLYAR